MAATPDTFRLFVALYPPPEIASAMLALLRTIDLPDIRTVSPSQVHVTAQFIGNRPRIMISEISDSLQRTCRGIRPFTLAPASVCTLPHRGLARTVVVHVDRPATLLDLHARLAECFARHPRPDAHRRYLPHLTLGRFPPPGRHCELEQDIELDSFTVTSVHLMQSELRVDGARHHLVASIPLSS